MLRILKIVRARALAPSDAPAMGISIYICVVANIGGAMSPASKRESTNQGEFAASPLRSNNLYDFLRVRCEKAACDGRFPRLSRAIRLQRFTRVASFSGSHRT